MNKLNQLLLVVMLSVGVSTIANAGSHRHWHHTHTKHKSGHPVCIICQECPDPKKCQVAKSRQHRTHGTASWYGPGFHGRRTASGERFNQHALTAAHKTLPLGSRVMVRNLENDETVIVTINDRGPFVRGRIIDLSRAAAKAIGLASTGTVEITMVKLPG